MNLKKSFNIQSAMIRLIRGVAICLLAGMAISRVHSLDFFIKFEPGATGSPKIEGESLDESFPGKDGWFEVKSFSFGIQNITSIGSATGGAGAGKAAFLDLELAKNVDSASPKLFQVIASGQHYESAKLVIRKGGSSDPYLTYEFKLVFLTSQKWSGAEGDDVPAEDLNLKYGALKITYRPTDSKTGKLGPAIEGQWNVVENRDTF